MLFFTIYFIVYACTYAHEQLNYQIDQATKRKYTRKKDKNNKTRLKEINSKM